MKRIEDCPESSVPSDFQSVPVCLRFASIPAACASAQAHSGIGVGAAVGGSARRASPLRSTCSSRAKRSTTVFSTSTRAKYLSLAGTIVQGAWAVVVLNQHILDGCFVFVPLRAIAPIFVGQLPRLVGPRLAILEAAQLLVLADVHPELEHDRAKVDQLRLEVLDLLVGALPFLRLWQNLPRVPPSRGHTNCGRRWRCCRGRAAAARSATDSASRRHPRAGRRWGGRRTARVEPLGQAVDSAALARGIPAFKDDHARALLVVEVVA
jgi:hypothetical protein